MFAIPGPGTASSHTVEMLVWVWGPTSELALMCYLTILYM